LDWTKDTGISAAKMVTVYHAVEAGQHSYATVGFAGFSAALAGTGLRQPLLLLLSMPPSPSSLPPAPARGPGFASRQRMLRRSRGTASFLRKYEIINTPVSGGGRHREMG
jgi:hypothetical protein